MLFGRTLPAGLTLENFVSPSMINQLRALWALHHGLLARCEAVLRAYRRQEAASNNCSSLHAGFASIRSLAIATAALLRNNPRHGNAAFAACLCLLSTERKVLASLRGIRQGAGQASVETNHAEAGNSCSTGSNNSSPSQTPGTQPGLSVASDGYCQTASHSPGLSAILSPSQTIHDTGQVLAVASSNCF